jgi:hypothetical protein
MMNQTRLYLFVNFIFILSTIAHVLKDLDSDIKMSLVNSGTIKHSR